MTKDQMPKVMSSDEEFDSTLTFNTYPEVVEPEEIEPKATPVPGSKKQRTKPQTLPPPPTFPFLKYQTAAHSAKAYLPETVDFGGGEISPLSIFCLFFPDSMLKILVENTNGYARAHYATRAGKRWIDNTIIEIKIWIAMIIYMSIHKENDMQDYWNKADDGPSHPIASLMTFKRFQRIKKYFHISSTSVDLDNYYEKVEPLLSHFRKVSQSRYVPKRDVSVDEMIVQFSGRSCHTYKIKNKPTPEGYKILALCDAGYTYAFLSTSIVKKSKVQEIPGLTYTGNLVNHLVQQLPLNKYSFNIYMDNYFTSFELFEHLRKQNIGACGTARKSIGFAKELNITKTTKLDWNVRSGFIRGNILGFFWQDNGPVTMLTTTHNAVGENCEVTRPRKRPRESSTNGVNVRRTFGNDFQKWLPIPRIIDDYNMNMNGVDRADQLRAYYITHQRSRKNWMPLFFWILDTSIVNCYIIAKMKGSHMAHKRLRKKLYSELVASAKGESMVLRHQPEEVVKVPHVSTYYEHPPKRLLIGSHYVIYRPFRRTCHWCLLTAREEKVSSDYRSYHWCYECKVPLCINSKRNCFFDYHTQKLN